VILFSFRKIKTSSKGTGHRKDWSFETVTWWIRHVAMFSSYTAFSV